MRTIYALVAVFGMAAFGVASADEVDDVGLIAQAASERPNAPGAEAADRKGLAADLGQAEREARIDLTLAQGRLELVLARKALRTHQIKDAAIRAQRVLDLLKELPPGLDASEYELQAEGILARAEKAGVDLAAVAQQAAGEKMPRGFDDYLDRQTQAAAEVGRRYTGADRDTINTRVDAQTLRQRTLQRQIPGDYGYRPGKEIFDTDAILERDRQRVYYEDALQKAYSADAARLLTEADEARVAPVGEIAYPDDWPEKVAKRAKYAGGEIARSESWIDQEGREWYVAVYDIRDLIYVPPDFQPTFSLDPAEDLRNTLDRHALRWGYGFFGGLYPWDLDVTIPLLRYFGGVDDYAWRGPKYSAERQEQIVAMIKAFTTKSTEKKIIPLGP
jgi:hypothetical protein